MKFEVCGVIMCLVKSLQNHITIITLFSPHIKNTLYKQK